jgi:Cu-Zn family superoxide dismutase
MAVVATVCFTGMGGITGSLEFREQGRRVLISGTLRSKRHRNSMHGIHIHEAGDLSDQCAGACAHFNPYGTAHGGPDAAVRHVGDLGNIEFDAHGVARVYREDRLVRLRGTTANVIGRSVVIHADPDDLGLGGHGDSLTTGHAGKRIACAVIGYSRAMFTDAPRVVRGCCASRARESDVH